jgi:hypothetical protein
MPNQFTFSFYGWRIVDSKYPVSGLVDFFTTPIQCLSRGSEYLPENRYQRVVADSTTVSEFDNGWCTTYSDRIRVIENYSYAEFGELLTGVCIGMNNDKTHYVKGVKHGVYQSFYTGTSSFPLPREYYIYRRGKIHGVYMYLNMDGTPAVICEYRDGVLHGEYREWKWDVGLGFSRKLMYHYGDLVVTGEYIPETETF